MRRVGIIRDNKYSCEVFASFKEDGESWHFEKSNGTLLQVWVNQDHEIEEAVLINNLGVESGPPKNTLVWARKYMDKLWCEVLRPRKSEEK